MKTDPALIAAFAPTGRLRAAINLGNPVLAKADSATGKPQGKSVDLAHALSAQLGVPLEFVVVDSAGKSVKAVKEEEADVGFFAIDPLRGAEIAFTPPYLLIEGCYLVRSQSPIICNEDVDRPGVRVAVGGGSAYDLYLSREIKHAQLVRAPTSPAVVDTFLSDGLDVAAGVKQQLEADALRIPGLRLLPGRFMLIQQAMGVAKSRGPAAAEYLCTFIKDMQTLGVVENLLDRRPASDAVLDRNRGH